MAVVWLLGALAAPQAGVGAVAALTGPSIARPSALVAEVALDSLGVVVQVGNSMIPSAGRGLFLRLDEGVEDVIIPSGTTLCGYCDGVLVEQAVGDKVQPSIHRRQRATRALLHHLPEPVPFLPRTGGPVCVRGRAAASAA
jgi:hypothetical protein